jgi:membrane protein DedA with SNARE-associated domain
LVFATVLLDQQGIPTPAIPVLTIAGALATDGRLSATQVFAVRVVTMLIADRAWYAAGGYYSTFVDPPVAAVAGTEPQ